MKKGSKSGLLKTVWGFALKTVPGIHDPRLSLLLFRNKNHETRGLLVFHCTSNVFYQKSFIKKPKFETLQQINSILRYK